MVGPKDITSSSFNFDVSGKCHCVTMSLKSNVNTVIDIQIHVVNFTF